MLAYQYDWLMPCVQSAVNKVSGGGDASHCPAKPADSAVELTKAPMQQPSVSFPGQPPQTAECDAESRDPAPIEVVTPGEAMAEDITPAALLARSSPLPHTPYMARGSISPSQLTTAEVDAMASNNSRAISETSQKGYGPTGVDMYNTDTEAAESSLGPPKKSVTEAYDDLWS